MNKKYLKLIKWLCKNSINFTMETDDIYVEIKISNIDIIICNEPDWNFVMDKVWKTNNLKSAKFYIQREFDSKQDILGEMFKGMFKGINEL